MVLHQVATPTRLSSEQESGADPRLHGRWLVLARIAWGTVVVLALGLLSAKLPAYFMSVFIRCTTTSCRSYVQELHAVGLSVGFYAWYLLGLYIVMVFVYLAVGAVIFCFKSDNRVALLTSCFLVLFPTILFSYVLRTLPPVWWVLSQFVTVLGNGVIGLFFYVFPNGRFVPRWTSWLWIVWIIYWGASTFFFLPFNSSALFLVLNFVTFLGLVGSAVAVQVYRYRCVSTPVQRRQTKWVIFGLSWGLGGFLIGQGLLYQLLPLLFPLSPLAYLIGSTLLTCFILLIPLFIGIALLHARLFDIDILINRTLVYGTLTGILALVYVGSIIALQALLRGLFHQTSEIAIVVSTLLIYALFFPLRRQIQMVIDRRFYRRKYDASKVIAAFSATLRTEVDLDQLREALVAVVQETMRPAHVSLWLRPPTQSRAWETRGLPRSEQEESIVP